MASLDFPASPSPGDTYTFNGISYTYNGDKGYWEATNKNGPQGYTGSQGAIGYTGSAPTTFSNDITYQKAVVETVYALSGTNVALDPSNGTIQTHTLTGNTTYTDSLSSGEYITLQIDDGTGYVISSWPTMVWVGGSEPTLPTTGEAIIEIWKVGSTLYGCYLGVAS